VLPEGGAWVRGRARDAGSRGARGSRRARPCWSRVAGREARPRRARPAV